ncbi:MAG: UvrD-helicase domain-containing protein [Phototrophicaceae bacterium]
MATFTSEQEQAIFTHDKNLIVVAGAGSGKTRVLVERYLELLNQNRDWRLNQLVAITFTREAAYEMRDRVRKELENRVQHPKNDDERRHWSDLLGQMDSARIDTIHGMCATILRANAAEAQIDPRFDVLEPIEAESILSDIIDAQLQLLAEDDTDDLAVLFTEYDMRDIRSALSDQSLLAVDLSNVPDNPDDLFEQWQNDWKDDYTAEIQRATISLDEALNWMPETGYFPEEDKLAVGFQAIDAHWDAFIGDDVDASLIANQDMQSAIDLRGGSAKNWGDKETVDTAKDILKAIRTALQQLQKDLGEPPAELDYKASEMLIRWMRLFKRVQNAYQQQKATSSWLDFNDLEVRTAHLLAHKPAVRERYQAQEFKRLLVDEFQDTNQAQWDIVRHLASLDDDVAMFLVGDPKQSIYAFRGADVSVFADVRQHVGHHPNGQELDLTVSFRSHPGLINAFNKLFAHILTRDADSPVADYEIAFDQSMQAFRQALPDKDSQTYAPIELLIQQNFSRSHPDFITSDQRRLWEAYEIGTRLQQLRREQAPIHDKDSNTIKAFDYGDAALLFQSTSHITTYEQIFKAMKIPFVTLAGRGYYNRQEVWDVLNLLKALHNPSDNLSLAVALRSPMFGFSDEILLALRLLREENARQPIPLWQALQHDDIPHLDATQIQSVVYARKILHDLHALAGRVTISELLRVALAQTGYMAALTGLQDGARLRRNVEKLVDIAEKSQKITLGAFSHYLNDLSAREVREGEATLDTAGVVRLMTVHASKGLEFPVVVLADASWSNHRTASSPIVYDSVSDAFACKIYDENEGQHVNSFAYRQALRLQGLRDEAERKRLLYVAATRARDCLIISGEMSQNKSGWRTSGWLDIITQAIGMESLEGIEHKHTILYTPDTIIQTHLPTYNPDIIRQLLGSGSTAQWEKLAIQTVPTTPHLMQSITIKPEKMLGHIAATQLANVGGYHHTSDANAQAYYRNSVRRHILDDGSPRIHEAIRTRDPRIRPRQLGEVVHEALRYWRFPSEYDNIDAMLRSYAWQQNITDEAQIQDVVKRAHHMLDTFQTSDIYRDVTVVKTQNLPYFAELPFIYRTDKRIIHGVIDMLYHYDGQWWLVDYKTSTVKGGIPNVERHAHRYYLQVGAYASAVRREIGGETPRVLIHYIQYNKTIEVATDTWETEIQKLENYIGELIG